jgi:diadenosine tetraphosphate (Ap4A) HIT family hydrolase
MPDALAPWDDLIAGRGCPICADVRLADNEYHAHVGDLAVSSLYLQRNQTYRGYCVLIFNPRHVTGLELLTETEFSAFNADLRCASRAIAAAVSPDHMNYATLGNVIPHLHYDIMPRFRDDPRWGAPIWTSDLKDMEKETLPDDDFAQLLQSIKEKL